MGHGLKMVYHRRHGGVPKQVFPDGMVMGKKPRHGQVVPGDHLGVRPVQRGRLSGQESPAWLIR